MYAQSVAADSMSMGPTHAQLVPPTVTYAPTHKPVPHATPASSSLPPTPATPVAQPFPTVPYAQITPPAPVAPAVSTSTLVTAMPALSSPTVSPVLMAVHVPLAEVGSMSMDPIPVPLVPPPCLVALPALTPPLALPAVLVTIPRGTPVPLAQVPCQTALYVAMPLPVPHAEVGSISMDQMLVQRAQGLCLTAKTVLILALVRSVPLGSISMGVIPVLLVLLSRCVRCVRMLLPVLSVKRIRICWWIIHVIRAILR